MIRILLLVLLLSMSSQALAGLRSDPRTFTSLRQSAGIGLYELLISYWPFEESSGTNTVDIIGPNNGWANNARVFTSVVAGIKGNLADFTQGDDYIRVPDTPDLRIGTSDFTIYFWEYITAQAGNDNVRFSKGGVSGSGSIYLYQSTPNRYRPRLDGQDMFGTGGWEDVVLDQWNFIVLQRSGSNFIFRVNNTTNTSGADVSGVNLNNTSDLFIGSEGGTRRFLNGRIDQFGIQRRALSLQEINHIYNGGSGWTPLEN